MVDSITWRTTDATRWGSGKGSRLSKTEIDINFWVLLERMLTVEHSVQQAGVGIHDFYVSGSDFYVVLTDSSQLGPYALPATTWNWTNPPSGAWVANSNYKQYDVFTYNNVIYQVNQDHTSASTFSPGATDGSGHDLYTVMLSIGPQQGFTVTGSTFTPDLSYANSYIRCTASGGCAITIPSNASYAFPLWSELTFRDATAVSGGSGLTFAGESPATINRVYGYTEASLDIGATIQFKKVDTDAWDIFGLLLPGSP